MKRILCAILTLLCLTGCAAQEGADLSGYTPAEEERLILYTSLDAALWEPLVTEFQNRTGIWVQVVQAPAAEAVQTPELWDVLLTSGTDALTGWENAIAGSWTGVSQSPLVLIYNPKLVRLQIPTGWSSLLDPVWQEETAFADPRTDTASCYALGLMYGLWGDEGITAFCQTVPDLLENSLAVTEEVADGSYCLGVVTEEAALMAVEAGYNLALLYPEEGSCAVWDCAGISVQAPHRENAEAFLAFLGSSDAQSYMHTHCGRREVGDGLTDIPGSLFTEVYTSWETCAGLWTALREDMP